MAQKLKATYLLDTFIGLFIRCGSNTPQLAAYKHSISLVGYDHKRTKRLPFDTPQLAAGVIHFFLDC